MPLQARENFGIFQVPEWQNTLKYSSAERAKTVTLAMKSGMGPDDGKVKTLPK